MLNERQPPWQNETGKIYIKIRATRLPHIGKSWSRTLTNLASPLTYDRKYYLRRHRIVFTQGHQLAIQ